jgi:cell division protein FtsI/penicillin-binding protein 2
MIAYAILDARNGRVIDSQNERVFALPGSTVKPFLPLDGSAICRGELRIGPHRLDCTHPPALGPLGGRDALMLSCNHYFAAVALRMSPQDLRQALRDFAPSLAFTDDQRRLQALGHWGVSTTPLYLAMAYRRLLISDKETLLRDGKTGTTAQGAWFAGWHPPSSPSLVAAVLTGGRGSTDARPAAMRLFEKWSR